MDNTPEHGINLLSLCTGYGGIELGMEMAGTRIGKCVYVERDAYAAAVLVKNIEAGALAPGVVHTNVETFPFKEFGGCFTGLVGGYPCQGFSLSGKRQGEGDEKGRHLWPIFQRAIRLVQPRFCFFENVEGHITLGLKNVLHDLDELGFRTSCGIYSAEECGAPQTRKRVFILAHASGTRSPLGIPKPGQWQKGNSKKFDHGGGGEWPAPPGFNQHDWEEPRLCPRSTMVNTPNEQTGGGELGNLGQAKQGGQGESATLTNASEQMGHAHNTREPQPERGIEIFRGRDFNPSEKGNQSGGPIKSELGFSIDGGASGVDANANRIERLRMLGNGVVPATAAKAWIDLNNKLNAHE